MSASGDTKGADTSGLAADAPAHEELDYAERDALAVADDPILRQMLAEERIESEGQDRTLLWRLVRYLGPHKKLGVIAVVLAVFEATLMTLPAYFIGLAVDQFASSGERELGALDLAVVGFGESVVSGAADPDRAMFLFFGVFVAILWILRWMLGTTSQYLVQKLGQLVVHDLRRDIYRHITGMDMGYFHENPVGRLVNRTTFDVQSVSELFSDAFAGGMRDLLFILVLMGVMLTLDVPLALILICSFPALFGVGVVYRHYARPAMRTVSAVQSRMNAWLAENLAGMRENHLYRRQSRRRAEYHSLTDAHQRSTTHMIRAWGLLRPAMMLVSAAGTTLVLFIGYQRVTAGIVTVGVLMTFIQYTTRLWVPVRNLTEKLNLIQTSLTSAERIADVLDTKSQMTDAEDADASLVVSEGRIELDGVWFKYPSKAEWVLRGIDIEVPAGKMLALVGDTGAGKSTIIHLVSRFYDVGKGAIRVDGQDVKAYRLENLRRGIALVPQDVVIFAGTLRENITLGADADDARIIECLEAIDAMDLVTRFDDGLDQVMDEGGRTLSAGERQLLSFARALVANPPILILDEATANIDSATEARIQQAMDRLTIGRTSVVIAHRLSTIRNADEIVVLRHGAVVERGPHDALLAAGGEYARLHELHVKGSADR